MFLKFVRIVFFVFFFMRINNYIKFFVLKSYGNNFVLGKILNYIFWYFKGVNIKDENFVII